MDGEPDYNALWAAVIEARWAGKSKEEEDSREMWDARAAAYDHEVTAEGVAEESMIEVLPGETVLDIGAGTGRLSVPLARRARSITALDVSSGMLARLEQKMKDAGLANYQCIRSRWEDVEVGRDVMVHDVVVDAWALGFVDLRSQLEKMDAAAHRAVYLFWHAGEWRDRQELELWEAAFGREATPPYPDYLWVIHILHEMGIYADVAIFSKEIERRFSSPRDAADNWKIFHDPPGENADLVEDHFRRILVPDGNGYVLTRKRRMAMIRWETGH